MRSVHELNENELEELRHSYFFQLLETDQEVLGDIEFPRDIPMANVIEYYEATYFVDDDFFCNL